MKLPGTELKASFIGGDLVVEGASAGIEVYDISGRKVAPVKWWLTYRCRSFQWSLCCEDSRQGSQDCEIIVLNIEALGFLKGL